MAATNTRARRRQTPAARARAAEDVRRLDRINESLEAAQKDLTSIGSSLGAGVRDLSRDVTKLLKDARRDLRKMRRAVERDLERLQKDLTSAPKAKPRSAPPVSTARTTRKRPAASTR